MKTPPSSMRLSSSKLEMTRPLADPHPGQVLSDGVVPRRVTFSQSRHSKNFGSNLRAMATPSRSRFLSLPMSGSCPYRARPLYPRAVADGSFCLLLTRVEPRPSRRTLHRFARCCVRDGKLASATLKNAPGERADGGSRLTAVRCLSPGAVPSRNSRPTLQTFYC